MFVQDLVVPTSPTQGLSGAFAALVVGISSVAFSVSMLSLEAFGFKARLREAHASAAEEHCISHS